MPQIKIYSTATCAFCRAEKAFFDAKGVKYEVFMADSDRALAEELMRESGGLAVPFTIITKDDGTVEKVLGFDQARLTQILAL